MFVCVCGEGGGEGRVRELFCVRMRGRFCVCERACAYMRAPDETGVREVEKSALANDLGGAGRVSLGGGGVRRVQ